MAFDDRSDAGRKLAERLTHLEGARGLLVLALPRGGVPVGLEVARRLRAPLDVFMVRRVDVPGQEELAIGAIASGGATVLNQEVIRQLQATKEAVTEVTETALRDLERRERAYRGDRPPLDVKGRTVIVVDDGWASGATMRAAAKALRQLSPKQIIAAAPVSSSIAFNQLRQDVDEVVCLLTPPQFASIDTWYENFAPVSDSDVTSLLTEGTEVAAHR